MDYKELVERLNEWNENLISELCGDDVLTCDDLCGCTRDCIVVQAATAITDLLARAEAAEDRAEKAERERDAAISVLQNLRDSALTAISEYEKNQKQKYGQKED